MEYKINESKEIAFRWDDTNGKYKVLELIKYIDGRVAISIKEGIKEDKESRKLLTVVLSDEEFYKLYLCILNIHSEKIKEAFKEVKK